MLHLLNPPYPQTAGSNPGAHVKRFKEARITVIHKCTSTRFMCTQEAPIHQSVKDAIINANEKDTNLMLRPMQHSPRPQERCVFRSPLYRAAAGRRVVLLHPAPCVGTKGQTGTH
ncbi:uncharacterized protein EV422DRAFT_6162 [Fimicolochytrium jonesii]|uniref:uncharacterized protein n=1 Tax=Fimicolochytrium jonesii TaxID=1396493 RepID=UPI0022FED757|nr:uncharacterized protein EV422DRAFT_6162 [Fimicolochytrium jonesii]KAI8826678.1 hypothetical protein EV422DRAFT_6162 [Fimicolochytrium jonesii]